MHLFPNIFSPGNRLFYCILAIIALFIPANNASADLRKDAIKAKKILSARLDSIEMEKQDRKRQGKPLDDLETESKRIHDSIVLLRTELSSVAEPVAGDDEETGERSSFLTTLKSFFNPGSIFDWILIIVGIVALLSGIVLVAGLAHTLSLKKKSKSRPKAHILPKKPGSPPPPPVERPPEPPPAAPEIATEKETRGIESIRKRMESTQPPEQAAAESVSPFAEVNKPEDPPREREKRDSIRDQVILAANDGLDVHEISRKLHVSVDQVTLILRIAAGEHKKDR